jgi:plastocyanin
MTSRTLSNLILACALGLGAGVASAQEAEAQLVIRNHKFEPAEITVPAEKKVKLVIDNQDATAEEFESYELNREKVVPPKSKITIFVGPLKPGRYPFFGDFHKDTAQGVLIAK